MNLTALILFGSANLAMVAYYLRNRSGFYEFPFWLGALTLGWFLPQAIGALGQVEHYPDNAYANALLFATLCSLGVWAGYAQGVGRSPSRSSWLDAQFEVNRLYMAGATLCACGFFFQYKLRTLPKEMLESSQWSGAAVKYLFLSNIFIFGFIALWLIYLSQRKRIVPRLLLFIVPSLMLLLDAAFLSGRRSAMMSLLAYTVISLWFVRRIAIPRWMILGCLSFGLLLVNAIGTYRSIMKNKDESFRQRLSEAAQADYTSSTSEVMDEGGAEFDNYLYYRLVTAEDHCYDYGLNHWNRFVYNFVPAQIVGRSVKEGLMIGIEADPVRVAESRYGHVYRTGSTATGYRDAFASFGWFGFIKFILIGWMMGVLYRHAMQGHFLGQLLYVYMLSPAMHSVSHETHRVLVSMWVYFFALGYPLMYFARQKGAFSGSEVSHVA